MSTPEISCKTLLRREREREGKTRLDLRSDSPLKDEKNLSHSDRQHSFQINYRREGSGRKVVVLSSHTRPYEKT